jgi:hypothetical protein
LQMTILDADTFGEIKPEEMLLGNWTRPNKEEGASRRHPPHHRHTIHAAHSIGLSGSLTLVLWCVCSGAHADLPGQLL